MEKTSYGTVYKAKLADGGTIALRLLREGSCKDRSSCLQVIKQLGRIRHENLIPLRAFYQGKRGEKLFIYDYLPNKTPYDLLHDHSLRDYSRENSLRLIQDIVMGISYIFIMRSVVKLMPVSPSVTGEEIFILVE